MKSLLSFITLLALALTVSISSSSAQQPNAPSAEGQKMMEEFMKMPEEQRIEYNKNIRLAQKLLQEKRIFDSLQVIGDLEKIYPNHPSVLSLKGASYVEMRAFEKAYAIFEKLHQLSPQSINISFNLAELDFVMRNWEAAHERFTDLITRISPKNKSLRQLSEFKLLLCKLKSNRVDEARAMQNKYGEWDDTPYFYYAPASILYFEGKDDEAKKMLRNALFIWRDKAQLSAWQDTLIEFGYVRSLYGDGHSESDNAQADDNEASDNLAPQSPEIAPIIPLDTE